MAYKEKQAIWKEIKKSKKLIIEIVAYCFMPNHFHLLLKQQESDGIAKFLSNFQEGYAKYYNIKYQRKGPLFQGRFQAVPIDTDEQLLHVSRYIHLNPFTGGLVRKIEDLSHVPFNSFQEYVSGDYKLCRPKIILAQFKSPKEYQKFVYDQAEFQEKLQRIEKLLLDR